MTNASNATHHHSHPKISNQNTDRKTSPVPSRKSQASSYQKYVIEKQQVKQHFTQRTPNDSTTKFMISKILSGELENISTNSSNSNKAFVQNGTKSSLKDEKANLNTKVFKCLILRFF